MMNIIVMLAGCNICAICLGSFHVILRELPFLFEEIRVMDYEIQKNIKFNCSTVLSNGLC